MKRYFTLVELLVVVIILGAVTALLLPQFGDAHRVAIQQANDSNMHKIREAFTRFVSESGIVNDVDKLEDIVNYGLWPMFKLKHPNPSLENEKKYTYPLFDPEFATGRRMGYIATNAVRQIVTPTADISTAGQLPTTNGGVEVPVLLDPYGGYYRVLCPKPTTGENVYRKLIRLKHMILVSPGKNGILEITPNDFDKFEIPTDDTGQIAIPDGSGFRETDDVILRLMPNTPYFINP